MLLIGNQNLQGYWDLYVDSGYGEAMNYIVLMLQPIE